MSPSCCELNLMGWRGIYKTPKRQKENGGGALGSPSFVTALVVSLALTSPPRSAMFVRRKATRTASCSSAGIISPSHLFAVISAADRSLLIWLVVVICVAPCWCESNLSRIFPTVKQKVGKIRH